MGATGTILDQAPAPQVEGAQPTPVDATPVPAGVGQPDAPPAAPAAAPGAPATTEPGQNPTPTNTPQPAILTPVKRGGIAGIVDELRDAISGTTSQRVMQDEQGNKWMRVAGTAFRGAAAGLANGQGPGGRSRALQAGIQSADEQKEKEQQQNQNQNAEVRQAKLDNFNFQKLQHDLVAQDFELTYRQHQAGQEQVKFAQEQQDRQLAMGSADLGSYSNPSDFTKVQEADPTFWKNVYQSNVVRVPEYDAEGKQTGFHVYLQKPNIGAQLAPKGTTIRTFSTPGKGEQPGYKIVTPTVPMTNNEVTAYNAAAEKAFNDYTLNQAKLADEASKRKLEGGQTAEAYATANQRNAEARNARLTGPNGTGAPLTTYSPQIQQAVQGLANYSVDPNSFPTRTTAKSGQMDRETAIGLAKQVDPGYDETQYKSRSKTRSDFSSGNARKTINSLNQAVNHLNELSETSKALNNGHFQTFNSIGNWLHKEKGDPQVTNFEKAANAVQTEMATVFKGSGATDQEIKSWRDTLNSAQSPAQLQSGINELLKLMKGRLGALDDQWTSSMGGPRDFHILSPQSEQILHGLGADDLVFSDRANIPGGKGTPNSPNAVQPGEPTAMAADGKTVLVVRNGQWVPAAQ